MGHDEKVVSAHDVPNIRHTKLPGGVWDLYEHLKPRPSWTFKATISMLGPSKETIDSLPFVWRMIKDVASIRSCWHVFGIYLILEAITALLPAVGLSYSGQLIEVVQNAIEHKQIDSRILMEAALARIVCIVVERFANWMYHRTAQRLTRSIYMHYSVHVFRAQARLDVPTSLDPRVQRQLRLIQSAPEYPTAWAALSSISSLFFAGIQLVSQLWVLSSVLKKQPDAFVFAGLRFAYTLWKQFANVGSVSWGPAYTEYAGITRNEDYIRFQGLKRTIDSLDHRQEIVAGGLWEFIVSEYDRLARKLGIEADSFHETFYAISGRTFSWSGFLSDPVSELPRIIFALRAVKNPAGVPVSLASLNLVTEAARTFSDQVWNVYSMGGTVSVSFVAVRQLYEVGEIQNKVPDGRVPFPENARPITSGTSLELKQHYRDVSFTYPGAAKPALQNVSFVIERGQLCVIVGSNGSGKSTILKLIARIHDPSGGVILLDGVDIKSLRLTDLRRALAALFQDYTLFPLSIKENIGIGDPEHFDDLERVQQAAKLGGADGIIEKLPHAYDTYLQPPVQDIYASDTSRANVDNDYEKSRNAFRKMIGLAETTKSSLSGGQLQRIALARCFMKSIVSDDSHEKAPVGLLLFDEPSAALDPKAEHDLFQRLRQLRGNKTMVFSSHRFGNLTRHADIILYMDDSKVVEMGKHDELLEKRGPYSEIWELSVASFLN
ncbi:P-loop containing nucleoside triphosphate hydrolase protein [Flagelloscypha sp. PMI_526]|nr:P-loop containing nucleoside triphosphate hydrolase protein [Flagelloscypha sp. PMI_526]